MPNYIPETELVMTFARSSGAGGQNVNKVSSKVILTWNVARSHTFSDAQKERILSVLKNRVNHKGELSISSESERTQVQNRRLAVERLQELVKKAIYIPKKRRATKPTRASKLKRLDEKKKHSGRKKMRKRTEIGHL